MYHCVLKLSVLCSELNFGLTTVIMNCCHCRHWGSVVFNLLIHFCESLFSFHLIFFYMCTLHLSLSVFFLIFFLSLIFTDIISFASALHHFSLWSLSLSVIMFSSYLLCWLHWVDCRLTAVYCYSLWWVSSRFKMCILVR